MKIVSALHQSLVSIRDRTLWYLWKSHESNLEPIEVSMLVVNKKIYSKLAHFCVLTFLFYHPRSKIKIYHDTTTSCSLRLRFLLLFILKRNRVELIKLQDSAEWQVHKLRLIFNSMGSHDYFMDCDLKWNGALPTRKSDGITFFVEERPFGEYEGLDRLLLNIPIQTSQATMRNTSIFSWGGTRLDYRQIQEFLLYVDKVKSNSEMPFGIYSSSFKRIYEQISLSLIPELYSQPFCYLKKSDQQFDGSICESSYFGASGARFAWWGKTSRVSPLIKKRS